MGLIQNLLNKSKEDKSEFKEKLKQAQADRKIEKLILEREKSSNERELESHINEQREAAIKEKLQKIHKKKNQQMWKSDKTVIGNKMTILNSGSSILKEKHIFINNPNVSKIKKGRMHFK